MNINLLEGRTFGKISILYDRARISYPKPLIDDIVAYSKIKNNERVLDVGCGTGQATILFAERGFQVVGLDVSREMVGVAKKKCSSLPNVNFEVGAFEEIEFPAKSFEVMVSGMAWHWIKPEKRYEKAFHTLKTEGTIALFWSYQRKEESAVVEAVGKVLDKYGREERGITGSRIKQIIDSTYNELMESSFFTSVEVREYVQDIEFSKQRYLELVLSYGWVQMLSDENRNELTKDLQKLFEKYKDSLIIPYQYIMVLAKKIEVVKIK